ncbi:hypothetical protein PL11201_530097 [Planktothrix sp. PCC 11201]|nr:hypothetical protein PL11201_530097 [Planktothrix sp. PCC 11201]
MQHLPPSSIERINCFVPDEKLWLAHEFQNIYDHRTYALTN